MLISMTVITVPVAVMPRSPKLSSSDALLSLRKAEIPVASASTNGTSSTPVTAPAASKDMASISGDKKIPIRRIRPYMTVSALCIGMP